MKVILRSKLRYSSNVCVCVCVCVGRQSPRTAAPGACLRSSCSTIEQKRYIAETFLLVLINYNILYALMFLLVAMLVTTITSLYDLTIWLFTLQLPF